MSSMKPKKVKPASPRLPRRTYLNRDASALSENLHTQIERRAYEIYEQRLPQSALDDWLQAEREVLRRKDKWNDEAAHRGGYAGQEQE